MSGADPVTLHSLASVPRWVAWRTEPQRGTGRITKVPKNPRTLRDASSTDPGTWGTLDAARDADKRLPTPARGAGGVGLILGECEAGRRIGGVDLDSCRDPESGAIEPWARDVLALLGTYTEVSPSGTGAKAMFVMDAGAVSELRAVRLLEPAGFGRSFKRGTGADHPPAIEVHLGGRYYAVTGERLPDMPAALRPVSAATLSRLLGEIGPPFAARAHSESDRPDRSASAFRAAKRIKAAGGTYDDFLTALDVEPDTSAWKREKGSERELKRAWERAGVAEEPEAWGNPDITLAERDALPPPAWADDLFPGWWSGFITSAAEARGCPPPTSLALASSPPSGQGSETRAGVRPGLAGVRLPPCGARQSGYPPPASPVVSTRPLRRWAPSRPRRTLIGRIAARNIAPANRKPRSGAPSGKPT